MFYFEKCKRSFFCILVCASALLLIVLSFSACTDNINADDSMLEETRINEPSNVEGSVEIDTSKNTSKPFAPDVMAAYRKVLLYDADYYGAESGTLLNINQWCELENVMSAEPKHFSILDLDGDGVPEIVLSMVVENVENYGSLILHYENGTVIGYNLWARAFQGLQADGTFSFSSSAFEYGLGCIDFSAFDQNVGNSIVKRICYCELDEDQSENLQTSYYNNGGLITSEEFDNVLQMQNEKETVTWIDFSEENIEDYFQNCS